MVVFWIISLWIGRLIYLRLFKINEQISVTSDTVANVKKLNEKLEQMCQYFSEVNKLRDDIKKNQ